MSTDPALHQSDLHQAHIRDQLTRPQAHFMPSDVLADFSLRRTNDLPPGAAHTPWQELWPLRYAQHDTLESVRPEPCRAAEWPASYWPAQASGSVANQQVAAFNAGQFAVLALLADHNACHLGKLTLLRRLSGGAA
ncbi:hypothetical protein [Deinococcus sp.]|uniref:hypothetical protein n=1 Tax=Deinococcus sp. TaxID=47478 RepID=UPI0025C14D06|nr:hypothetical protein [Deinococcus sp.]